MFFKFRLVSSIKKIIVLMIAILLLSFVYNCDNDKSKKDLDNKKIMKTNITIEGKLKIVGSSPLIKLSFKADNGNTYYLSPKFIKKYKKLNYFDKTITISGKTWKRKLETPDKKNMFIEHFLEPEAVFMK